MKLSLAFSPCPNDCFIFDAIVHRRIDLEGIEFDVRLADVEALNQAALERRIDVTKLSCHAYLHCAADYVLLDAGSALGRGCGPLLISKRAITAGEVSSGTLRIAGPGRFTTAQLLLGLAFPGAREATAMVFSEIEGAVLGGGFDAGLIIHENRFTYEAKGLRKIVDLGEFWEREAQAPIPLGAIAVRRSLNGQLAQAMNRIVRRSVEYAFANPSASRPFVRGHAQEMSDDVVRRHIDLYVNDYSRDLGEEGRRALRQLFARARAAGVAPAVDAPFLEP
ncbi:MAG: 1,4-dihydroxy-6-naphthoate synthase [Acidobacteria bacterium]|nr:1,4-dihydroxy-6-naphthoate synthase [Acidobacteriota bacterium]